MKIQFLLLVAACCIPASAAGQVVERFPLQATQPPNVDVHRNFVREAQTKMHAVVFLGDSQIGGWKTTGAELWKKEFEPLNAGAFGVGGQPVGHLVWRLQNGLLSGYEPRVVLLGIGNANLFSGGQPRDVAGAVEACVAEVHKQQPRAKVIVLSLAATEFPPTVSKELAEKGKAANALLARLDNGKTIRFLDLNEALAAELAELQKELAQVKDPHQLTLAYAILARGIRPVVDELLQE